MFAQFALMKQLQDANKPQPQPDITKSSSNLQTKSPNAVVEKPFSLKDVKKHFKPFNIYLFQCNRCDTGLHALHIDKCLNTKCDSINSFKQEIQVDDVIWMDCFKQLDANFKWSP
jgi:hypothetical protein